MGVEERASDAASGFETERRTSDAASGLATERKASGTDAANVLATEGTASGTASGLFRLPLVAAAAAVAARVMQQLRGGGAMGWCGIDRCRCHLEPAGLRKDRGPGGRWRRPAGGKILGRKGRGRSAKGGEEEWVRQGTAGGKALGRRGRGRSKRGA